MRRRAYRPILDRHGVANAPNNDFAGVETYADLRGKTSCIPRRIGSPFELVLHGERRARGTNGMVFVRNGSAKDSHDSVAEHLIDRPVVLLDPFSHDRNDRVE